MAPVPPPLIVSPRRSPAASKVTPPYGFLLLAPVKVASVVSSPVDLAISNTVPSLSAPPALAVPKRSPAASMVRPPNGSAPLAPVKVASVVSPPVDAEISNTVPSLSAPPALVVPKRSPAASMVRPPNGFAPLAPVKVASVVSSPVALETSNTVPSLLAPPNSVVPKRSPAASMVRLPRGKSHWRR